MRFLHLIGASFALAAFATSACTRSAVAPPASDQSHPSARPGGGTWASCGFPPEADTYFGIVRLRVLVSPKGAPSAVEIISASEPAFAQHARSCALSNTYRPSVNAAGEPIAAYTRPFTIRFQR